MRWRSGRWCRCCTTAISRGARLQDLYEAGHLGIKTGKGFYDWSGKDADKVKAEAGRRLAELLAYLHQQR